MPIYTFRNPDTGEEVEIVQKMSEDHSYVDNDGKRWDRVYHSPNASIDTKCDGSLESFMRNTEGKKGTMGDLWDASKEASEKRKQFCGEDSVQKKYFKNYSEKRNGLKHEKEKKEINKLI